MINQESSIQCHKKFVDNHHYNALIHYLQHDEIRCQDKLITLLENQNTATSSIDVSSATSENYVKTKLLQQIDPFDTIRCDHIANPEDPGSLLYQKSLIINKHCSEDNLSAEDCIHSVKGFGMSNTDSNKIKDKHGIWNRSLDDNIDYMCLSLKWD